MSGGPLRLRWLNIVADIERELRDAYRHHDVEYLIWIREKTRQLISMVDEYSASAEDVGEFCSAYKSCRTALDRIVRSTDYYLGWAQEETVPAVKLRDAHPRMRNRLEEFKMHVNNIV